MMLVPSSMKILGEVLEEVFFVLWAAWQYLRIIITSLKQKQAAQNAKNLIDFTNVMESEFVGDGDGQGDGEEVIVFDLKKMDQKARNYSEVMEEGQNDKESEGLTGKNKRKNKEAEEIELQEISGKNDDDGTPLDNS